MIFIRHIRNQEKCGASKENKAKGIDRDWTNILLIWMMYLSFLSSFDSGSYMLGMQTVRRITLLKFKMLCFS